MRTFLCLLDLDGHGISERVMRTSESRLRNRSLQLHWQAFDQAAVLTAWDDPNGAPLVASDGPRIAVGVARFDNRSEIERLTGPGTGDLTDLALALRAVTRLGSECIPQLLGDFGFLVWDARARSAVAVCDALAVKKLYYAQRNGLLAFADHAEALAVGDGYEVRFLAEQVAACEPSPDLTVYSGVKALPGGTMATLARGRLTTRRYWDPEQIAQDLRPKITEREVVEEFRRLFVEAVRSRLSTDGESWAQLSGGLDSSSVVSVAQWLVEGGTIDRGLEGTVTYVDREATAADERHYSNPVVTRWRLRNETIVDPPMWYDQRHPVPHFDQPRPNFMFYPREIRLGEIVRRSGARVLLTGQGPDEYLRGSMFFFADWLAQGRLGSAVREMARWAAIGRVSLWQLAYRNAVMPLLPRRLRQMVGPEVTRLPPWINPTTARRFELHARSYELALYAGSLGHKYQQSTVKGVSVLAATTGHLVLDDVLDVRHPFLDRRLVEFGLRLPPEMTTQPYAGKWVLREAMRGIVPEVVRTRVGKATQAERHAWALTAQQSLLEPLVREPILEALGVVDGAKLRAAFYNMARQPRRRNDPHAVMGQVLAIEAWLQIGAGRWPRGLPHYL